MVFYRKKCRDNDIAAKLDTAMKDIEDANPPLKGNLPQNNYASLGADKNAIKSLIDEINKLDESRFHEEDLIGRVYEYFLQNFAASESKEDGEFYTPACCVKLISELIEPYDGIVYDPCCGSGGMFVQSMKFVDQHKGNRKKVSVVGQESNPDTWRLAKMNLAIRGISCDLGEKNASTFTDDQHKDTIVQYIMANPPFNLKNWRGEDELVNDPRFKPYKPAMPPVANANYAWILHMLSKFDVERDIAGFLLANGALNAGSGGDDEDDASGAAQYQIRKKLLENDKIETIIVLPRDMFYTTDISVTLWIMNNMLPLFRNEADASYFIDEQCRRKWRNAYTRKQRFAYKAYNQNYEYFFTITFDSKKHTEESFEKSLKNALSNLHKRYGCLYLTGTHFTVKRSIIGLKK